MLARARRRSVALSCFCLTVLALIFAASVPGGRAGPLWIGPRRCQGHHGRLGARRHRRHHQQGTGLTREAVTDTAGHYNFRDLPAGVYSLKVSQQGFKTSSRTEVTVTINSVTRVDVTLEIGAMGDTVTVKAERPKLQTDTAEVHQSLVAAELTNLPVPLGRNYQQVYRMLPGFAPPFNSHSIPTNPSRSLEFTVNGTSDDQNNTRIDGVSTYTRPAAARRPPTCRRSSRSRRSTSSPTAWTPNRGSPAAPRSTCRPRAAPTSFTDLASSISRTST